MLRLFVAIDFADSIKRAASTLKTDIPTARWVDTDSMHLTLRFLGDVEDDNIEAIKSALSTIKLAPFDVTVYGVGRFPLDEKKAPLVLWMSIATQPALNNLQAQVEAQMKKLGFPPDEKPFYPHITLAWLNAHQFVPEADAFLRRHEDFSLPAFRVTQFYLYSSILSPQGAKYTHEAAFSLQQA